MITTARRILTATTIALAATLTVAACSAGGTPTPTKSPTPTPTTAKTVYNDCIDGAVQLWDEDAKSDKTITTDDCAAANLISSDRTYALGTIPTITVEATGATITVKNTKTVVFTGNDNHLTYDGPAPKIDDQGTGNSVTPAG